MGKKLELLRNLLNEVDTNKKNVFQEGPAPLTTEEKRAFAESLKTFSQLGESIYSTRKIEEAVTQIESMVETANRLVTEDSADLVDSVSAGRHFKLMNEALKELKKSCNEIMIHERRAAMAYEDIAEGLKKYYEI